MNTTDVQRKHDLNPTRLLVAAAASLLTGTVIYLLARPMAPALMISLLTSLEVSAQRESVLLPFALQLPSFFHMLAMLLATLAVTANRPGLRVPALGVTVALGVAVEVVQHPAVTDRVGACAETALCGWLPGLEDYARNGTFDPLDLVAIACATIAAVLISFRASLLPIKNRNKKDSIS